jgi:plastocyanin
MKYLGKIVGLLGTVFSTSILGATDHTITQKGKLFSAENLSIGVGDSVVFKNDDDTSHNVFTASDVLKFNLGIQKPGTDSKQKFETPGTYEVRCAIHPKMKLKVVVKP